MKNTRCHSQQSWNRLMLACTLLRVMEFDAMVMRLWRFLTQELLAEGSSSTRWCPCSARSLFVLWRRRLVRVTLCAMLNGWMLRPQLPREEEPVTWARLRAHVQQDPGRRAPSRLCDAGGALLRRCGGQSDRVEETRPSMFQSWWPAVCRLTPLAHETAGTRETGR